MGRFVKKMGWVECPTCGKRFSPYKRRVNPDNEIREGRWKMAWQGNVRKGVVVLMVGRYGYRGWLGTWQEVMGGPPHIVPAFEHIGSAMMGVRGVLRKNGLWCKDLDTGHWRRVGKADVHARTPLGQERLRKAGWPNSSKR